MNTEIYLKKRAKLTRKLVNDFNLKHNNGTVYLVLEKEDSCASFSIHFRFNDKFVDTKIYDEGSACIYVTDALYEEIQKLAGDVPLSWNNTGSIGWLSLYEMEAK